MDIIKLLKIELQQKEQELIKAAEMMKFYKLELVNRENNFNKVFNAQPNIGLMNPFDLKVNAQLETQSIDCCVEITQAIENVCLSEKLIYLHLCFLGFKFK
jgi:hypothetical protein